jgi:predicted nucleic acid-binding protein
MIVVSDTTPLNYLILVEAIHVLPALFGRVYAPEAVIRELRHSGTPEPVRGWAESPPDWLIVQNPTEIDPSISLGPGESAAIALAQELKADWVLIDDRRGSRDAQKRGFRVAGTLGILEEAGVRNLVDYTKAASRLVNETNMYLTEDILQQSAQRHHDRKAAEQRN